MKKRNVLLVCIGAPIFLIVCVIIVLEFVNNEKFYISESISSVSVSSSLDGLTNSKYKPRVLSDKEEIDILLKCLKNVKVNNQHSIKNIQTAPIFYEITFTFESGETKTYEYTVYPATKCNNPFEDYYKIFSEDAVQ